MSGKNKIFISYRRADAQGHAQNLLHRLADAEDPRQWACLAALVPHAVGLNEPGFEPDGVST